jgi:hypothetical protein
MSASDPHAAPRPALGLPALMAVQRMLADLLGVAVTAKLAPRPFAADEACVAIYSSAGPAPVVASALVLCDLGFVAGAGAALSMLPVPLAAEALKTGRISETLMENWGEVVNVCSSLFNEVSVSHVRLTGRFVPPARPAPEVISAARTSRPRLDLDLVINPYGSSKLSLVCLVPKAQ